jgi:hypothetical protein
VPEGLPWLRGGATPYANDLHGLVSSDVLGVVIGTSGVVATAYRVPENQNGDLQLFCNNGPALARNGHLRAAGGSFKWFRDTLCQGKKRRRTRKGIRSMICSTRSAVGAGGSAGVISCPMSGDAAAQRSDARGTFVGLS